MISRIKQIIKVLNEASEAYYQKDNQIMSDFEYDKMYDELEKLEKETGVVFSDSPTVNIGYKVISSLNKVKHEKKILSLDKTKDMEKIEEFLNDKDAILSFKMDGLTVVLTYEEGTLKRAVTRGNGEIGEDVTHNVLTFKNVPLKIPYLNKLIVRGEALISFKEFERINNELSDEEKYKNPRNLCSGTVRQLNSETTKKRNVTYMAFSLFKDVEEEKLKSEQLDFLKKMGFYVVEHKIVNKNNVSDSIKNFEKLLPMYDFATDGLVLTFNDILYSKSLGETSKFPKDSIAFKWADEVAQTKLIDVLWNTSRTGLINPIALFEPVELEGTTVNRASLHNISIIKNLELGLGDTISIYKANMIIPQVAENFTRSNNLEIPKNCLVCGGQTEIINIREGISLKCTNEFCRAKLVNNISHYVSRNAMNIEGFSEATIERFIENGFLKNYTDIYFLENFREEIVCMYRFGEKSFNNLIKSIEKSKKNVNLSNFIYALGLEQVGIRNAKLLAKHFNFDFDKIRNAKFEDLIGIEGFGEVISKAIVEYFSNSENLKLIDIVLSEINFNVQKEAVNQILKDKIFVITGSIEKFKNRKELQEKIEQLGGKVSSSVSKNTSYLINNDLTSNSSKNKKAISLNVEIINEKEFLQLIE